MLPAGLAAKQLKGKKNITEIPQKRA